MGNSEEKTGLTKQRKMCMYYKSSIFRSYHLGKGDAALSRFIPLADGAVRVLNPLRTIKRIAV